MKDEKLFAIGMGFAILGVTLLWMAYDTIIANPKRAQEQLNNDKLSVQRCLMRNGIAKLDQDDHYVGCFLWPMQKQ